MHSQTFNLQQWRFCHVCQLLKCSKYQKHTQSVSNSIAWPPCWQTYKIEKQQIIKPSYTYMHLTHNKTHLFQKSLLTQTSLSLCFANESGVAFSKNSESPWGSTMNPFVWLGQPSLSHPLPGVVLAWLDQGPLSQCKLAKATHRFPRWILSLARWFWGDHPSMVYNIWWKKMSEASMYIYIYFFQQ